MKTRKISNENYSMEKVFPQHFSINLFHTICAIINLVVKLNDSMDLLDSKQLLCGKQC
jgi:hypothetical protein